jgi:hypothetical protein
VILFKGNEHYQSVCNYRVSAGRRRRAKFSAVQLICEAKVLRSPVYYVRVCVCVFMYDLLKGAEIVERQIV